jgi:hypothetical protein
MATGEDYGEDFLVRIFHKGNPTGHDFYVQLKGTKTVATFRLKSGELSCPIEAVTLKQWYSFQHVSIMKLRGYYLTLGMKFSGLMFSIPSCNWVMGAYFVSSRYCATSCALGKELQIPKSTQRGKNFYLS